jgi:error-prone DNA polymerase
MSGLPAYAELHCLTNFTFLTGASHPDELVSRARALEYTALAITDECSLAGVVRAHAAAKECGQRILIGSEIGLQDGPRLVLLACDREGYGNLSELVTLGRRRAKKGSYRLERSDLASGLPGCLALWLAGEEADAADGRWLGGLFPDSAWIACALHRAGGDRQRLARLRELGADSGLPLVAVGSVLMHERSRKPLQDLLTGIRLNLTVAAAGHALQPNAERHLRDRRGLGRFYPPDLLAETLRVAGRCRFSLDELRYEYPDELVPSNLTPAAHLRQLALEGLRRRWPAGAPEKVRRLVDYELALIAELDYEPYFLTVHDIVRFARSQGILCQGRGSAANSAVCYCLGITEVDPARMEMLFERFISKERNEPPDIDVDFEHQRREEVLQYVYRKYGRHRAALAATVISYRPKSAIRDAGKALGLDPDQVDRLARSIAWWDGQAIAPQRLREAGLDPASPVIRQVMAMVSELQGFPRHLSQHVGGMVISRGPVSRLVPVENAAMAERTIIQWDKDDLDVLGLLKVDCLALGMLSAIRRTFELVNGYHDPQQPLGLHNVPPEDPAVYRMIQRAETTGVFQIESRAQMAMLPRLKPACFYDLVIEVAIVRPGPIQGDMVHPYLRRRQGLEPVSYPSDEVREVLGRTLGVPIFQEQVIKVAQVAAGFSLGEADHLRRSIGAWRRRGSLEQFERRLVEGMMARGYAEPFARQIYQQILGFGEYGFPESHSASFALLVYVSAWLKHHHPAAFFAALLNSQPMGFYAPAQLVAEARRQGVTVRPPDVRFSDRDCTLERPFAVVGEEARGAPILRLGLRLARGLSRERDLRIGTARAAGGFGSVDELAQRARLDRRDLKALAAAGALRGLSGDRHRAAWQVMGHQAELPLFAGVAEDEQAVVLPSPTRGQDIVADYASFGLTLGAHPLSLLRQRLEREGLVTAAEVRQRVHGTLVRTGGIVINRQHPASARGVIFVTLEDETGQVNLVVWQQVALRQRRALLGARLLGVIGEVQREGEVIHVVARRLYDHSGLLGRLPVTSRDFR